MLASAATRSVVGRVGFGAASPHVVAAWTSAAPAASYHSKRQARKHAFLGQVRRRVNGQEATPTPAPSGELKYPLTHVPTTRLANGWTPPPDNPPDLPFRVQRTATGQFLPVYTDIKNARSRVVTVVRNIDGDIQVVQSGRRLATTGNAGGNPPPPPRLSTPPPTSPPPHHPTTPPRHLVTSPPCHLAT